jgi:hypothetical protein
MRMCWFESSCEGTLLVSYIHTSKHRRRKEKGCGGQGILAENQFAFATFMLADVMVILAALSFANCVQHATLPCVSGSRS